MDSVTFPAGDPANPRNWPLWRKWSILAVIILVDLTVSWTASGFSPASAEFSEEFGVSTEVATLGLSLTVLGFALGPMTLAPLSEYFGRSPVYIGVYGVFLLFLLGTALVQSLGGFLVLRLFAGLFCSVTIGKIRSAGLSQQDLYLQRTLAVPLQICGRTMRRVYRCRFFCGLPLAALHPATFSFPSLPRLGAGARSFGPSWASAAAFGS